MHDVLRAFLKAFRSQLHPRMLMLALLPFFGALVLWAGVLYVYWDPLEYGLRNALVAWSWFDWFDHHLAAIGVAGLKSFLVPILITIMVVPLTLLTAMLIVSLFAMPVIFRQLCAQEYADVAEQGSSVLSQSLANTLIAILVFATGWLLTLPLWLIPPLGLILPFFWIVYLNLRILRVDALVQHAAPAELKVLLIQHHRRLWGLSTLVTLLCTLPLMWIVAPVFSGLAFAHYQLAALRGLRAQVIEKNIAEEA